VEQLGQEFNFRIVTRDRDLGDSSPYPTLINNQWLRLGNASVFYVKPGIMGLVTVTKQLVSADRDTVLYLNSFFSLPFSILPIVLRWIGFLKIDKVLLAPRGEFSPGALAINSLKKRVYVALAGKLGLYKEILWQSSTEIEMQDIYKVLREGLAPGAMQLVIVAKDIASAPSAVSAPKPGRQSYRRKTSGQLRVIFLARISKMKNLIDALSYFHHLKGDVEFAIYGPVEDQEYWKKCKVAMKCLPPNVRATYYGPVQPLQVHTLLSDYDLLLLPTLGENYGHVISEALMAGSPALISDRTPWQNLEEHGVGWSVPLSEPKRFEAILQQCLDADEYDYAALRQRVEKYRDTLLCDTATVEDNRRMFQFAYRSESF